MRAKTLAIVSFGIAIAMTSCSKGSSPSADQASASQAPISKAEFVTRANAVCTDATAQLKDHAAPGDPSQATSDQLQAWVDFLGATTPIISDEASKLTSIPNPNEGETEAAAFFLKIGDSLQAIKDADVAAKAGNLDQFKAAGSKMNQTTDEVNKAASAYGLTECAK